jgi:hypothetical protein
MPGPHVVDGRQAISPSSNIIPTMWMRSSSTWLGGRRAISSYLGHAGDQRLQADGLLADLGERSLDLARDRLGRADRDVVAPELERLVLTGPTGSRQGR